MNMEQRLTLTRAKSWLTSTATAYQRFIRTGYIQAKEAKSFKYLWGTLGKDWRTTGAKSRPNRT